MLVGLGFEIERDAVALVVLFVDCAVDLTTFHFVSSHFVANR